MNHTLNQVNLFQTLKSAHTVSRPATIRHKLAAWAFDDAEDVDAVIANLDWIDCAGCHSPAPIYYADMAREIGEHWPEVQDAFDDYRETVGEPWTPQPDQSFLAHLWFAYEWIAHNLAHELRQQLEAGD